MSLPPPNETGAARVGRYELLLELASGGMATVFVGRQRGAGGFERLVAVKRMHPHIGAVPELAESFLDEARIASQIHHPNVVSVLDVHEDDGERLLVMDYIDGTTLSALVKTARKFDRRLPVGVAVHVVVEALRGLHAAHELRSITGDPLDVVHRDATPQNILLGADGGVRLTDFGIAKAAQRTVQTTTGNVKGKFRYMAPEQAMGKDLDRRVDIFAMGAVLWELLTGRRFLAGSSDAEIIHNLVMGKFVAPHEVEASVPMALSNLVMKALAEQPEERWITADLFADVLENWAREANQEVTPAELAELINELCGGEIAARRKALREVIAGQRPPVNLTQTAKPMATTVSEPGLGSNSALSVAGGLVSQETPVLDPRPPLRRNPPVALLGVGAVALLAAGVIAVASKSGQEKSAIAAVTPSAPVVAAATAEPTPVEPRVSVALSTELGLTEVRGPGVSDIQFRNDGATFSLPKSVMPVRVQLRFVDGSTTERTIVPTENSAMRVVASETSGGKGADSKPSGKGDRASGKGDRPAARPADARPDARPTPPPAKTGPALKSNPYGDP